MNPNPRIVAAADTFITLLLVALISVAFWLQVAGVQNTQLTLPFLLIGVSIPLIYGGFVRQHLQRIKTSVSPLAEDSKETKVYHRGYYDGMHGNEPSDASVAYEDGYDAGKTGKAHQLHYVPRNENPKVLL